MAGFTTEPAYEDAYERIDSAQRFARWFGLGPEYVVTTIYDSTASKDPEHRYVIGWGAKTLLFLDRLPFTLFYSTAELRSRRLVHSADSSRL